MFIINKSKVSTILSGIADPKLFLEKSGDNLERCQVCKGIPVAPVIECKDCQSVYYCKQCVTDETTCEKCESKGTRAINRNIMQMTFEKMTFSHECFSEPIVYEKLI